MIRGVHWRSHQRYWRAKTQSSTPDRLKHAQTRIGNKRCVPRCFCHTSLLYRKLKTLWRLSEIQQRSLKAVYLAAACVRVFSNSRLVSQAKQCLYIREKWAKTWTRDENIESTAWMLLHTIYVNSSQTSEQANVNTVHKSCLSSTSQRKH